MPAVDPKTAVRGQYVGYHDIEGVNPGSDTETFVALRLEIENWRWAGVPILVRTGKALPATATEIVIRLQRVPQLQFGSHRLDCPGHDDIVLRIGRHAGISIFVRAKTPGKEVSQPVSLDLDFAEELGEPPQPVRAPPRGRAPRRQHLVPALERDRGDVADRAAAAREPASGGARTSRGPGARPPRTRSRRGTAAGASRQ